MKIPSRPIMIFIMGICLFIFTACARTEFIPTPTATINPTATPTPLPSPTPATEIVSVTTEDNVKLSGTIYPAGGDTAVIFAHMGHLDQTTWEDFAKQISKKGVTAVTFDLRCHGKSQCKGGNTDYKHIQDIIALIRFLRQRGYNRLVCVGGSMGGAACMNAAVREDLIGLAIIASGKSFAFDEKSFPKDLVNPDMPKLYIYTEEDRYIPIRTAMPYLYSQSPEPKEIKVFPGQLHGIELFDGPDANEFSEILMDFLLKIVL